MTVKFSTRVVATPQIPRSMSSQLDLPSASPTRSIAASAIPVTHVSSSRYSCSEDLHRMPLLRPSQSLPSSIVSGILKSCVVGIPPFTRLSALDSRCLLILSAPRSATTLFISKVYRFGSLLWVSEKICWVSTACSGEHPSPPFDVPVSSPPISTFGVSPRYSPSPVKRMVVSNPRGLCYAIIVILLFYEDYFGGYTVFAYGFNLFLYREEYFATMPPLYERRCLLGFITETLLQFTHRFVILWSGLYGT
ncbi:hypothetical protein YC2023_001832 [Brassica napus]